MSILFLVILCATAITAVGLVLKSIVGKKSSSQAMLLGIQLTITGGIFIIGLKEILEESVYIGLILVITGFLASVVGFFFKNDKE